MTPLPDFDRALARHDWLFEFSDDHQVWREGQDHQRQLETIAKESSDHTALFQAYSNVYLSRPPEAKAILHELRQRLGLPPAP